MTFHTDNQTTSRSLGGVYQNTTAAPMLVNVTAANASNPNHLLEAFTGPTSAPTGKVTSALCQNQYGFGGITFAVMPGEYYTVAYDVSGGSVDN